MTDYHDKWEHIYDKLQYSSPQEVDSVWKSYLYDIKYLKRNHKRYYDHLLTTYKIISNNPTNPVSLIVKNHRQ